MTIETKELVISKELKRKVEMVCKFAYVNYTIINGSVKSIKNTNIAMVKPHIVRIKNTDFLVFDNLDENSINNDSFEQNAIDKIFYMTAIRVWIEKQFYENNPNDTSLNGKTFGKKLEYMFPRNEQKRWNGSENVTRKYLMSKKTMINQHNHYKSQILPFNYALNITLDELKKELLDIKAHFEN